MFLNYVRRIEYLVGNKIQFALSDRNFVEDETSDKDEETVEFKENRKVICNNDEKYNKNISQKLLKIWGKILDSSEIGLYDEFFALGGNSLNAVQIVNLINDEFGINLPLFVILENSNIYKLSQYILEKLSDDKVNDEQNIDKGYF